MNRACLIKNKNLHEQNQHASCIRPIKINSIRMKKIILISVFFISVLFAQAQANRAELLQNLEQNQTGNQNGKVTATLKSSSRLFSTKDDLTTVILIVPSGSHVEVLGSDSTYFHVLFEENEGYIFRRHAVIDMTPVVVTEAKQSQPQQQAKNTQAAQNEPMSRFAYLENKYGSGMAARLNAGKIWKGMNSEMVKDSWGNAERINRTISGNIIKEEWIFKSTWLYFENNTLIDWGPIQK